MHVCHKLVADVGCRIIRWIPRRCHWVNCTESSTCQRTSGLTASCPVSWDRLVQVRSALLWCRI